MSTSSMSPYGLGLMASERGKHFDPDVLDLFMLLRPQIASIREELGALRAAPAGV